jgi:hypothetical protein
VSAPRATSSETAPPVEVVLVFATLTVAAVAQGGFYSSAQRLIGAVQLMAVAVAWHGRRLHILPGPSTPLVWLGMLAG